MRCMSWFGVLATLLTLHNAGSPTPAVLPGGADSRAKPDRPPASRNFAAIAGEYHRWWGMGGESLRLSADGRFENVFGGCTGTSGWVGKYQIEGAALVLCPDYARCWHQLLGKPE